MKIDNSGASHPQVGLGDADIVYMEQVEGGLTRLAAVFSSRLPARVGPVRSARESDVELLAPFGRVRLGFSGAAAGVVNIVDSSRLVDSSYDRVASAYARDYSRPAPYNLFADPSAVIKGSQSPDGSRNVGLTFGIQRGGIPAGSMSVRVANELVSFRYDSPSHRWALSMDGVPSQVAEGGPVAAENVIVQYVDVVGSRFVDVRGSVSPYTVTTGSGNTVVFRDGHRFDGTWQRSQKTGPTRYLDRQGNDILLHPGTTWILLATKGTPLTASAP